MERFYVRCGLCQHVIDVEWGPETYSTADRLLMEHVTSHANYELRDYAIRLLVGPRAAGAV